MIGIVGLSIEYGNGLVTKADNQRTADAAAFSAGLAYSAARTAGATDPTIAASAAALRIAVLNGVASSAVATTYYVSPRGTGNQVVQVKVTTSVALMFARMLGAGSTLTVPAVAIAELTGGAQGCLYALAASPGTGIVTSGGATVTAPSCVVGSNNSVSVPCGTSITAAAVTYNSTVPSQPCGGLHGAGGGAAPLSAKGLTDPLAGNAAIANAVARIATVSALTSPAAPAAPGVSGSNGIDFGSNNASSTQSQAVAIGCTAAFSSPTWTLTCPAGNRTFASFTIQGGIRVNFAPSGLSTNTYSFRTAINTGTGAGASFGPGTYLFASDFQTSGGSPNSFASGNVTIGGALINQSSGALTFGTGTVNIRAGIYHSGSTMTFGGGTFNIGPASSTSGCPGNARYSVCNNGGQIVFGGSSTFNFAAGIYAAGGTSITLGSGTTNSYKIGSSLNNYAIVAVGGASVIFADATGSGSVFEANGNIASGGGGCLALPAAVQHDIDGNIDVGGGTILGAGIYTVNGFVAFGQAGGGGGTCSGASVTVQAAGVTLVVSGLTRPTSGACSGQSFCVAAGFSNIVLTAPTAGATANIVLIGPQGTAATAQNTSGALFTDGASNATVSGSFYYPRGPISLGGGSGVGNLAGQCLTLIGSQITLTGGTVVASTCPGTGGAASGGNVTLIQ